MTAIAALKPGYMVPLLGRVCSDVLPENTSYPDDGCEVAPRCVECPLERCRYEEPNGLLTVRMRERNPQIIAMRADGASLEDIAARFRLARRSVFRVLAGAKA